MSDTIISVENISKRYRIGTHQKADTLAEHFKNVITYPWRNFKRITNLTNFQDQESIFWALQDINFEVKQGEVLGIIGHNGAGKSTLLKILSRITEPTTGQIKMKGRLSALLEVGTGFHPELTGRDNVYMNGTILGMTKKEIEAKFDEIIAFSGIEDHLDTPVKFYSSGMRVRLAFSVAAHLEPEILVIDEVLAVGDAEFQKKCLGKMQEVAGQGRTVLFVSHDMSSIRKLCSRGIVLNKGEIHFDGSANDAINAYLNNKSNQNSIRLSERIDRTGNQHLSFESIKIGMNENESECNGVVCSGLDCFIHVRLNGSVAKHVSFSITISDLYENKLITCHTRFKETIFDQVEQNDHIVCKIPQLLLAQGQYSISINCIMGGTGGFGGKGTGGILSDSLVNALSFEVLAGDFFGTGKKTNPQKHGAILSNFEWYKSKS